MNNVMNTFGTSKQKPHTLGTSKQKSSVGDTAEKATMLSGRN